MGMNSSVELKVRTFTDTARERILGISLKDYNLINWTETDPMLVCEDSGLAAGRNNFDELMGKIAEVLGDDGMAYLIEAVDEDIPYATTYFYQGNGLKKKHFETDPFDIDDEEDPWDAAIERRKTYVPKAGWKGIKYSSKEKELLKKYPWIDDEKNDQTEDAHNRDREQEDDSDFIVFDDGLLYSYEGNDKDIIIPGNVKCIGDEVFQDKDMESVIISNGVTVIGFGAFGGCENLKKVSIPESMEEIGASAFCDCYNLHEITLPDGVINIGEHAFENTAVEQIMIPPKVDKVEDSTYSGCKNLSVVVIPDHVTCIGESAFSYCENLLEVTLPDTLIEIGDSVFRGCCNLKKINIPKDITDLDYDLFDGCDELTVTVSRGSYAEEYCKEAEINYIYE